MGSVLRALAPYLAYAYMTFVGWTTRLVVRGGDIPRGMRRKNQRFIFAFWHNRQVFFTYTHRAQNFAVLVSRSRDGEVIARTMELSRIGACRGSSSRGGATAVREMMAIFDGGCDLGLSPDGPKGPVYQVKPGIIFLAQKLGVPIIPISNALTNKLVLKRSWDKYQVPFPFGRAVICHGEPIAVGPDDDLEKKGEEVRRGLERATREAEHELGLS
jgi:lysophospholipid acyltransferase (LPLAT)-like uncharacterized protein